MKIVQSLSSTLLVAITEAIQDGKVSKAGTFSFPVDWETKTLSALGEDFSKVLRKSLDGSSLSAFVKERPRLIKIEAGTGNPTEPQKISRLKSFSDPLKTAREVVQELEKIPHSFRLVVEINAELAERTGRSDVNFALSLRE